MKPAPKCALSLAVLLGMSVQPATAETLILLGGGVAGDDEGGIAWSALADLAFTEQTSVSLSLASTRAEGVPEDIRTRSWDLALDHNFGPVGLELSAGQWGDPEHFDSDDGSLALYHRGDNWYFAASYLVRDIDLTFRALLPQIAIERKLQTTATGLGLRARYTSENGVSVTVRGRQYDYDADVTRLDQLELLRRRAPTAITLAGALLDSSLSAGIEWPVGERLLNVMVARDATATDETDINSLSVGMLSPVGRNFDLDVSLGYSRAANGDSAVFLSALLFYYTSL